MALAVEVSSNSQMLARDRAGLTRYAWNGIPCVWIVNLASDVIEVYTRPTAPGEGSIYEVVTVERPGETIEVSLGAEETPNLDVSELLA
ncbi:MAG: Uma2 family endonuclease [Planctomycetia bacterium]|nr:Uma2 family endonuclease [Planctomycetia bacterium]